MSKKRATKSKVKKTSKSELKEVLAELEDIHGKMRTSTVSFCKERLQGVMDKLREMTES